MLAENIRNLRKENKMSQEQLAEKLDVSRQSVSLWENGQTTHSMENIVAIANIFNVSTDILLKDAETPLSKGDNEEISENKKTSKSSPLIVLSIVFVALLLVLSVFFLLSKNELSSKKIYNMASPSTVEIQIQTDNGVAIGTGFFLNENGTIVTNFHVIDNAKSGDVFLKNGEKYKILKLLGFDKDLDIAIIQIDYVSENVLLHREELLETGDTVYALGSSLGLSDSFSKGIVSSNARNLDGYTFIQVTCPISQGNSGGPLIDSKGKVAGITSCLIEDGQNLNFAIPIANVKKINMKNPVNFVDSITFVDYTEMKKNNMSYWEWITIR